MSLVGNKRSPYKNAVVCVRFPKRFKQIMEQLAYNEGLDLSAWLRNLVIQEFKRKGILSEAMDTRSLESLLEAIERKQG